MWNLHLSSIHTTQICLGTVSQLLDFPSQTFISPLPFESMSLTPFISPYLQRVQGHVHGLPLPIYPQSNMVKEVSLR